MHLFGAFILAALVAAVATVPICRYARALGLLDPPNERSSHRVITPRGGGLAIILAAVISLGLLSGLAPLSAAWSLLAAGSLVGLVGAVDDRRGVPAWLRLIFHLGAAVMVVRALGPVTLAVLPLVGSVSLTDPLAWTLSILWLVAVTNFFNFMDGIDGLAGGQALATCTGVIVAGWAADASALATIVAGACAGFLLHNWPPARIFMGDSGSGFLGLLLAGLPMLAPVERRPEAILAVAIGMTLFLLDPILTLIRRALARKNILQAHRQHLYQQLVLPDESAVRVTTAYTLTAGVLAILAAGGYRNPAWWWLGCVASLAAFSIVWLLARARGESTLNDRTANH